jgi:hypothetical protein
MSNLTNASLYKLNLWVDDVTEGDTGIGLSLGHVVAAPFVATQAQILAQMKQRALTADFTVANNVFFPCVDPSNPETQLGSLVAMWAKSGPDFVINLSQPVDWNVTPTPPTPPGPSTDDISHEGMFLDFNF